MFTHTVSPATHSTPTEVAEHRIRMTNMPVATHHRSLEAHHEARHA